MKKYKIKIIGVRISPRMEIMLKELKQKTGATTMTGIVQRAIIELYNKEFYSNKY